MPVNPSDQQRAMFTIQRGPKITENDSSVSLDASSIEPAEPLNEISDPAEKEEYRARQSKIIALMGLDTIATAIGFDDFSNYFTLRSVESALSQEIIEEHIHQFNPNEVFIGRGRPTGDKPFLNRAAGEARSQRKQGNALRKAHEILSKLTKGVNTIDDNSRVVRSSIAMMRAIAVRNWRGSETSLDFRRKEGKRIGIPEHINERIDKFLGLQYLKDERPSFQYLKLASDVASMLVPRTAPTFFNSNIKRPLTSGGQKIAAYKETIVGWSAEGQMLTSNPAEGGGIGELNIGNLQSNWRISPNRLEHGLLGYTSEGAARPLSHLRTQPMAKNISALIYVIQRDHEMSERMRTSVSWETHREFLGMPDLDNLTMSSATSWAASAHAEGKTNILQGICGKSVQYEVEDLSLIHI